MAYPQKTIDEVLAYLDEGHSLRDAERRFGVGHESAARWRRKRDGDPKACRRSVRYPLETVRLALGLAYGGHGFRLDEVASMLGVSVPTISRWKKRHMEGGVMEIPDIDPDEIGHLSKRDRDEMSEEELDRYIHELEVRAYALEGTVRILKAEGIEGLSNDEKAALIDARPQGITATELLAVLGISSSSYYYCRSKPEPEDRYASVRVAIREEFELVRGARGYRYIRQRLRERTEPILISGKKVRSLMAEEGCVVAYAKKKRRRYDSYEGEIGAAPENLVARNFHADAPNRLWLTDVTQFSIPAGKAYLSPVIDAFDGMPVAWTIRTSPDAEMANTMLEDACRALRTGEAPVIHNDRGCHYRWPGWIAICDEHGLIRSMSRKGCSPDNSAMEGFFGRLKNEFYYRDWDGVGLEEFASQLDDHMRYYRDERIKESLGWMSPMQYRKSLGLAA